MSSSDNEKTGLRALPATADDGVKVLAHLGEVLEGPSFRSSQRSREFLRYVVENSVHGHAELLKERLIGERVFGRSPDYDTGQDSIVRVKANEVRRRLSQYYELHPNSDLKIELPSGSYVAQIHAPEAPPTTSAPPVEPAPEAVEPMRLPWRWLSAGGLLTAVVAYAALYSAPAKPIDVFWAPFLSASENARITVPHPEVFRIYGRDRLRLVEALKPLPPNQPHPGLNDAELRDVKIIPETDLHIGMGDARTLALIYGFAAERGKTPMLRLGSETSFTELKAGPVILIGGFTNRWTLDLTREHRFSFVQNGDLFGIRDSKSGEYICRKNHSWEARRLDDCAVVTRQVDTKTGKPLLLAAGLDHFGTFAVGEFVTRPELLEAALSQAPRDWARKNLQIVFQVEVVRDNVGPPKILAVHSW